MDGMFVQMSLVADMTFVILQITFPCSEDKVVVISHL